MITLRHATSGVLKECPTGFSFTTFLFGFFVPLFRKDFKWAAIMLVAGIAYGVLLEELKIPAGSGIALSFCFGFYYNEQYIKTRWKRDISRPTKPAAPGWSKRKSCRPNRPWEYRI